MCSRVGQAFNENDHLRWENVSYGVSILLIRLEWDGVPWGRVE